MEGVASTSRGHPMRARQPVNLGLQDFDCFRSSWLPGSGDAIVIGAADHTRSGPQSDCLDDVAAAANASVEDEFHAAGNHLLNFR